MSQRAKSLIASAFLGLVAAVAAFSLGFVGAGCFALMLLPVAGLGVGWFMPGGVPGASIAVAVFLAVVFPYRAGPTAKTLTMAFSFGAVACMLVCEFLGSSIRRRRPPNAGPDGGSAPNTAQQPTSARNGARG